MSEAEETSEIAACAECGSTLIETTGAARHGGGYHRRCENGHEWDDPKWSYFKAGM